MRVIATLVIVVAIVGASIGLIGVVGMMGDIPWTENTGQDSLINGDQATLTQFNKLSFTQPGDDSDGDDDSESDDDDEGDDDDEEDEDDDDDEGDDDEGDDDDDDDDDFSGDGDDSRGGVPRDDGAGDNQETESDQPPGARYETDWRRGGGDDGQPESGTRTPATPASPASAFEIIDTTLETREIVAGGSVTVQATVRNSGGQSGIVDIDLLINGDTIAVEPVEVPAGATETVSFRLQFPGPGEYEVAVQETDVGTVSVSDPGDGSVDDDRPHVVNATLPADWARTGFTTTVDVVVENPTDESVTPVLTVTVDGESVERTAVNLDAGESREATISFDATAGTVAVNGVEAGELAVGDGAGDRPDDTSDGVGAGFGPELVVALFLLAVSWVAVLRNRLGRR